MSTHKGVIKLEVDIYIEKDGDYFHAFCPAFKGLHTEGATIEEALNNAKDAVEGYLDSIIKHGEAIPASLIVQEQKVKNRMKRAAFSYKEQIPINACV